jgi:transposase
MVGMDARRAADAIKSRRIKSDKADAFALAAMLRTGWFSPVHVKSIDRHRITTLLGARDQLVKAKRALGNPVRGLLRPFGIRLPSRVLRAFFARWSEEVRRGGG